jgi:glutamate synthase (NADPH/NADH) large chain
VTTTSPGWSWERRVYRVRKRAERDHDVHFPSLSGRTIVYKGMITEEQLVSFYPDLSDERVTSSLGLVHSRFSTNTFPSWPLAHPYRFVAHNGEAEAAL